MTAIDGFDIAVGLMKQQITTFPLVAIRNMLDKDGQRGFDMAVSMHIGRVTHPTPNLGDMKSRAAYFATMGMQGGKPNQKIAMMTVLARDPLAKIGATEAIKKVDNKRNRWWISFLRFIGYEV